MALILLFTVPMYYQSMKEVEALRIAFEQGTLPLEEWNHSAHLALCCWYLLKEPRRAERLLREGIRNFNRKKGVLMSRTSGYHETLTLFWIAKVRCLLDVCTGDEIAVVNAVVAGLDNKNLVLFHYSREHIMSAEARRHWCEPDLRPVPMTDAKRWQWPQAAEGRQARLAS